MSIAETFEAHALAKKEKGRRLSLPISPKLEQAIAAYKAQYPNKQYSDTSVLSTMIIAGFKSWSAHIKSQKETQ
jgi:hypothetical protein